MSPYHMKIVYRTNIGVVIYLGLAWVFGRLSWPLVGFTFVFWLLLPFSVVWSWPEKNMDPIWWRVPIAAAVVTSAACLAFYGLDFLF